MHDLASSLLLVILKQAVKDSAWAFVSTVETLGVVMTLGLFNSFFDFVV